MQLLRLLSAGDALEMKFSWLLDPQTYYNEERTLPREDKVDVEGIV
jgi:hypothetical protein